MTILVDQDSIRLKEFFGSSLFLRAHVDELFDYIDSREDTSFVVDFENIQSMSRSFAHEFIHRLNESENDVSLINESENIKKLFDIVREPKKKFIVTNFNSKIVYL
jgi:hypothetical protein